jgi:MoxR-like ATPase
VTYIFSDELATFLLLAIARMRRGQGAVLLLQGLPGGGKTAFAKALAEAIEGGLHYYAGAPDRERDPPV